jgi:hypothetical protein
MPPRRRRTLTFSAESRQQRLETIRRCNDDDKLRAMFECSYALYERNRAMFPHAERYKSFRGWLVGLYAAPSD